MLAISKLDAVEVEPEISLPVHLRPIYTSHWTIDAMVGPYDEGYIVSEDIDMIYNTVWYVMQAARVEKGTIWAFPNYFLSGMFRTMPHEAAFALLDRLLDGHERMGARVDSTLAT
jgi:hypothetical protein